MKLGFTCWVRALSVALSLFSFGGILQDSSQAEEDPKIAFKWALLHLDPKGRQEVLNTRKEISLFSGGMLKLFIQPIENAYVYVYLLDSTEKLELIFPSAFRDFDKNYRFGERYYVPGAEDWLALDAHEGVETLFLLAARERLRELEKLTEKYSASSGKERESAKASVIAEIKKIKKRFRHLSSHAETPVPIAGTVRGERGDPANLAVQVEAKHFYSKTVRLVHK